MSSYGELIQALGNLKNVKEKRHGMKTLASLCSNRSYQVRIVQKGGWSNAILPLIISLDEECRKYAALAIANLSSNQSTHQQFLDEHVLRHLVPILHSEECQEVVVYVLNALGNFAVSPGMQQTLRTMNTLEVIMNTLKHTHREEVRTQSLFYLANMTADGLTRIEMLESDLHTVVWGHVNDPNFMVMHYALAVLRGLSVETQAQELLRKLGLVPVLVGTFKSQAPLTLKTLVIDIFLHLSFLHSNALLMLSDPVSECIVTASRMSAEVKFVETAVAIIANLCENVALHDRIAESELFVVITKDHINNESFTVQQHVIRALMQISLSPKYHHVILATDIMAKVCMIGMNDKLPDEMRINALEMMASICATHPTVPTETDVMDLLFLICKENYTIEIRRAGMLILANASAESSNSKMILKKQFVEVLVMAMSKATDVVLVDYMCQFFHNVSKMDAKAGSMMISCGYANHMFSYERLESLSITAAIYVCDTCRHLVEDGVVRQHLREQQIFQTMIDAWPVHIEEPRLAPHLALMCSTFTHHSDTHRDFVMQHGVRLVIELYSRSEVEHVRLCCILTLLYLADTKFSQRSIAQERGLQVLLSAAESENRLDLTSNALKALIPFASSDDYRPQLGMDGAIDTFASVLMQPHVPLKQLGIYLLQNLLELSINRKIFLGIAEEKSTEEDYMQPLISFLPTIKQKRGGGKSSRSKSPKKKKKDDIELTPHDPFTVRCAIHCIALLCLEEDESVRKRFMEMNVPQLLYTLFHSEQIDKSSGEAVLLFFANILHSNKYMQAGLLRNLDLVPMLLQANDLGFSSHTNIRCISALLSISRTPEFKKRVMNHLDNIMVNVNQNISSTMRDEAFYSLGSLQCALMCELAMASYDSHEKMLRAGVMEAFLVFITVAGRGLNDELCIELLMSATYGISTLCASPTCGDAFMRAMTFPSTRLQLLASLLRLPQDDINHTFYLGTVGLRTLQRNIDPCVKTEELHIDSMPTEAFVDMCGIRPADFIYRHVVRTLCLILGHPELSRRVQEALTIQNVVPTCQFALTGGGGQYMPDKFVQVLGYVLVARFSMEDKIQTVFVNDAGIMNEILECCRRFSDKSRAAAIKEEDDKPPASKIADFGKGDAAWTVHGVMLNRYLLAMVTLTSLAEFVKEKYRQQGNSVVTGDMAYVEADQTAAKSGLTTSNLIYLEKFTAACLEGMDVDELLERKSMSELDEFTAMLRVVVVHNTLMTRLEREYTMKGGLVKVGMPKKTETTTQDRAGQDLVIPELRAEFSSLFIVQNKTEGLGNLVEKCLQMETGKALVLAILECLCAMTYIQPQSLRSPYHPFKLLGTCPTWVQTALCCLLCNSCADVTRSSEDFDELTDCDSSYIFPLVQVAPQETRQYMLGALANIAARNDLWDFTVNSGVLRIYAPIAGRGAFLQEFGLIVEQVRILANLTYRSVTHEEVCTENVIGFLRDCVKYCITLLEGPLKGKMADENHQYDNYSVVFHEHDVPPLGLHLKWTRPAVLTKIDPGSPADFVSNGTLMPMDELIEINGVDVSLMQDTEITPMFDMRPLELIFRRLVPGQEREKEPWEDEEEEDIPEITDTSVYGDREQYLECFHLALLTLHNLVTTTKLHHMILHEAKILNMLLAIIPNDMIAPSLRRLIFSMCASLAQNQEQAERIFHVMADYFRTTANAETPLRKYIVLVANLYYTYVDKVEPDKGMLSFVQKLAEAEGDAGASSSLVEILHRMANGPKQSMKNFVCRETMILTTAFFDMEILWGVQCRAFEVAYLLTHVALHPPTWSGCDLLPNMIKAASKYRAKHGTDARMAPREDALWEMSLRCCIMSLGNNVLVKQMHVPELDRYLMDLFLDSGKPAALVECAAHLMSGLLQTEVAEGYWLKWKTMGAADKMLKWFQSVKDKLATGGYGVSDRLGESIDSVLHMILWAVDLDTSLLMMLGAKDSTECIGARLLCHANFFKMRQQLSVDSEADVPDNVRDMDELVRTQISFRGLARIINSLTHNDKCMGVLAKLGLSPTLVSLLQLPSDDFREACMVMLCSLCAHKSNCAGLLRSASFKEVMKEFEEKLDKDPSSVVQEELEYLACILDRSCAHPELAQLTTQEQFRLLCLIFQQGKTMDCQLLILRAVAQCAINDQQCLSKLPSTDPKTLHVIMANNQCLTTEVEVLNDEDMSAVLRREMINSTAQRLKQNPIDSKIARHLARILICEGISISREFCQSAFREIDFITYLGATTEAFTTAVTRLEKGHDAEDLTSGHLMNTLTSMLHVVLGVVFRGGGTTLTDQAEEKNAWQIKEQVVMNVKRVLDAVHGWLMLSDEKLSKEAPASALAFRLCGDLRVLFFLSALLREICAKPMQSIFLDVVRSKTFYQVLEGTVRHTVTRFMAMFSGPTPTDSFLGTSGKAAPLAKYYEGMKLELVFEHLLVCMRHLITQSMFIETSDLENGRYGTEPEPFSWPAQEHLQVHRQAINWLPDVVEFYKSCPGITVEMTRYFSALSSFYVAPTGHSAEGEASAHSHFLCKVYSIQDNPKVLKMFTLLFEFDENPCNIAAIVHTVSNMVEYGRLDIKDKKRSDVKLPVREYTRLLLSMQKILEKMEKMPHDLQATCVLNLIRTLDVLLAYELPELTFPLFETGLFQTVCDTFQTYFRDVFCLEHIEDFEAIAQHLILFVRNWVAAGCQCESEFEQKLVLKQGGESKADKQHRQDLANHLSTPAMLNLLVAVVEKLSDTARHKEMKQKDELLDASYKEAIVCMGAILYRQSLRGALPWEEIKQEPMEALLQAMIEHRRMRTNVFEDGDMVNLLYLITKQGKSWIRVFFPDFLMRVAYGPREVHTEMQDIAAVCCAMIATASQKGKKSSDAQINIADVVDNCGDFIRSMAKVPDPKMQVWHFRTITTWSQRPKVIHEVATDEWATNFICDKLVDDLLGRYSVVFIHNISVLRSSYLIKRPRCIAKILTSYRLREPAEGMSDELEVQRRMLRHLLLISVRNCLHFSTDLQNELSEDDLTAIVHLADCVEPIDVPVYLAMLMKVVKTLPQERIAASLPVHKPLVDLLLRYVFGFHRSGPASLFDLRGVEADLYRFSWEDPELEEEESESEEEQLSPTGSPTRINSKKKPKEEKKQLGLGKATSLYTQSRTRKEKDAPGIQPQAKAGSSKRGKPTKAEELKKKEQLAEYVYYAAAEILSDATFRQDIPVLTDTPTDKPSEPASETGDAVADAFAKNSVLSWLEYLDQEAQSFKDRKSFPSNLFVIVSMKFLWHCWSNKWFQHHIDKLSNLRLIARLAPFFLAWPLHDVKVMMDQVCIYARMHQFSSVCDWLVENYKEFPELSCSLLTHAFVDSDNATLNIRQGTDFCKIFKELMVCRTISRPGLSRVAVGVEVALLEDHPHGLAGNLAQKEHRLLGDLLEAMSRYVESGTVKQSMVATLSMTIGKFYKPLGEFDSFVLRILDMAPPMLEGEFEWCLPVLYRLLTAGGMKVKAPFVNKKLHMRLARMMEEDVVKMETAHRAKEMIPLKEGPHLNAIQRIQWYLITFTALASEAASKPDAASVTNKNLHFDSFICVDLLPTLVRILKARPHRDTALCVGFLVSSVSTSPCIVPHMPTILQQCQQAFPAVLNPDDTAEVEPLGSESWTPYTPPGTARCAIAMRRNLMNLMRNASYLPSQNPALLSDHRMIEFFRSLECKQGIFDTASAPLHLKLFLLAQMCSEPKAEVQELLQEVAVFDMLADAEEQLVAGAKNTVLAPTLFVPCDLRILWIHAVISLTKHGGNKMLKNFSFNKRVLTAIAWTEEILRENHKTHKDVGLVLECQQALAVAISPLSARMDFGALRQDYSLFLLNLICSAPLLSLRLSAADCLIHMLDKGLSGAEVVAAVFLKTSCLEAFKRIIGGPLDDLASACCRVIIAFVKTGYYRIHVHFLGTLDTISAMMGSPTSTSERILWLSEVFYVLTSQRTDEVIDAAVELPSISPFLGLAREKAVRKRELVQLWLEALGSSLYEIDEVTTAFQKSSFHGYLYVAARSVLDPAEAQELRRIIFGVIHRRIEKWRTTVFGIREFYTESLIEATLPMCERQPDLIAAVLALFHSFITKGETEILARIWSGGHFLWLCKRLQHKSRDQVLIMDPSAKPSTLRNSWDNHKDLTVTQGMTLRVLYEIQTLSPTAVRDKSVSCGSLVDIWLDYMKYYCQCEWPTQAGAKDVAQATDSILLLAMYFLEIVVKNVNKEQQLTLVQQGMMSLCLTVLLPNPENQNLMKEAIVKERITWGTPKDLPEPSLPAVKMMAGTIAARLTHIEEVYKKVEEKKFAYQTVAMFAHLHHMSPQLFDRGRISSVSVVSEVMLEERCATLYMYLVSKINLNWMVAHIGIGPCEILCSLMLDFWHHHWNTMISEYGSRIFGTFCQAHALYCSIFAEEGSARKVMESVHRMFGNWDARAYRHVLRLLNASMCYALQIPVLPKYVNMDIMKSLRADDATNLRKIMAEGGENLANQNAAKNLLLVSFVAQMIQCCEHPGDDYGRVWSLWLVLTIFAHANPKEPAATLRAEEPPPPSLSLTEPQQPILGFTSEVDKEKMARRARLKAQENATKPGDLGGGETGPIGGSVAIGDEALPPTCHTNWLRESHKLSSCLARSVPKTIAYLWRESNQVGVVAAANFFYEMPLFLETAAFTLEPRDILACLKQVEASIQLGTVNLIALISSMRLPLRAHSLLKEFLEKWYDLQEAVIAGFVAEGEGPYDKLASWLRRGLNAESNDDQINLDFKSMIAFIIGQGLSPPLAVVPSLNIDNTEAPTRAPGGGKMAAQIPGEEAQDDELPTVTVCPPPPEALLDRVALEVLQEDRRLKNLQDPRTEEGPLFSTSLCHLLYALAVMVPQHPKVAAHSPHVRGAAFSQLMKVQSIISRGVGTKTLYDPADGSRAKLFLYVRISASIRGALQSIMGSWFAADFGASFAINDEGGRDFVQYCTKHIIQVYNNQMVLKKVVGTPWERMMLTQGPTTTIAELLLVLCSSDSNLQEVGRLGGQQALLALSRYAETAQVRQQATMLLTKLAVLGFANPAAGRTLRGDVRS